MTRIQGRASESASDQEMRSYYASRMTYYDETRPSSWITPQLLDFVSGALRGSRMLEVACGTGYWTTRLSLSVSHIDAIDGDTSALRLARQKTYGCPVTFIHHDAFELDQLDR